ncbi:MAG: cytochrome b N-terminal domain-containing protein [Acidobacteriota bacterium]|jgi:quinol-cytochrome oxidoreductase complex cytochrome b subunit
MTVLPRTDRERAKLTRGTFLFHLRPIRLPRRTVRWTHTFGLGGSSLVLWCTLALTGILMLLVYQPVPDVAYDSVRTLTDAVRFGPLVRGVHYWSANLLVVVVLLHVARVVFTGGYHRPRRLNWIIGAALLGGVLAAAFTGYLLPWDQRAFWAVTISTGMLSYVPLIGAGLEAIARGGTDVGADTLLTFYTYHTTVLPVLAIVLMAFHFWRVRRAGGVVEPPPDGEETEEKVLFFPDLLLREASQALVVLALVVVLGAVVGAPIGERANPGMSPNPAKAPWYFMGFQELLIHLHPVFAVLVVPLAALVAFVALPWLGNDDGATGCWFLSEAGRRAAGVAAILAAVLATAGVLLDASLPPSSGGLLSRGLVPTALLAGATAVVVLGLRHRLRLGRNESLQTVIVFLVVGFATLTLVGAVFRGEGMALAFPWGG